ncbi:GNAT family N-acetyltransferase [Actinosynnema sp. NPDC047251]|uniref:N-acetyltransferase domain-containing protein n=1 Tax=Saccharothrix espanaensis (strain ATCC 51144 / DSM 44229 / JCM 9112 / NBRC 15066 / NRRL 15764) TaxID=1179773 RepID=K0JTA3_SACES|nr:GNAT family N-acetyltransferase [Saccharothrix espanaensis]CCH28772.1 hypothetical protein BN6_14490 [Saccharothrix espanaensis DSM 44229]
MGTITIRTPVEADSPAIVQLHVKARRSYYEGHLPETELAEWETSVRASDYRFTGPDRTWLCAELDGVVVGFALVRADELLQVQVDPAYWGRSVGRALLDACAAIWRDADVTTARLEVFEPNARARRLYAANGWHEQGVSEGPNPHVRMTFAVSRPGTVGGDSA